MDISTRDDNIAQEIDEFGWIAVISDLKLEISMLRQRVIELELEVYEGGQS